MKKRILSTLSLLLCLICLVSLCACNADKDIWADATYTEDTTLGTGSKTVVVEVQVNEHKVAFTVKTDKATLGEALLEHDLIAGDPGDFGLYVKKVNGMTADYDTDKTYWGFYQNGEYLMTGVDSTAISGGEHFEIVYSK